MWPKQPNSLSYIFDVLMPSLFIKLCFWNQMNRIIKICIWIKNNWELLFWPETTSLRREVTFPVRIWFMAECHSEASILMLRYKFCELLWKCETTSLFPFRIFPKLMINNLFDHLIFHCIMLCAIFWNVLAQKCNFVNV